MSTDEKAAIRRFCNARAKKAARLLKAYDQSSTEASISDCIADLMHLCQRESVDWLPTLERGTAHFNAELIAGSA